jgi:hypothetical protein
MSDFLDKFCCPGTLATANHNANPDRDVTVDEPSVDATAEADSPESTTTFLPLADLHDSSENPETPKAPTSPHTAARIGGDEDSPRIREGLLEKLHGTWILPQGDIHGQPVRYPSDEIPYHAPQDSKETDESDRKTETSRWGLGSGIELFKCVYSMILLVFSIIVVLAAIFSEQTVATGENNVNPVLAVFLVCFLITWLAMMEGGQGALVGLQPIDKELYAVSHPRTYACTKLAHQGNNMERVIVGRQFLVVLVVFVTNLMVSSIANASVLSLPDAINETFLATGLAVTLTVIIVGQLTAQVNAANCMLDFINNYFMLFTIYTSLVIEASGLLHSVYLVQTIFSKMSGTPIESNEPSRSVFQSLLFWGRVAMSLVLLGFSFAVLLTALFNGKTNMWDGIPAIASVIIFFILMAVVGIMEGMQIALFAVVNLPKEELRKHPIAYANCGLTFSGQNLQAFLIGRQICVTVCTFVIARITSVSVNTDIGENNVFGVSDGIQNFFNTGMLGALVTTIVASLAWRIIASSLPVAFMSNPLIYLIIRLCLILEATGLCSAAWVLALLQKSLAGYQRDDVYIGTAGERVVFAKDGSELHLEEQNLRA